MHETVDQRGLQLDAGCRVDAPGRDEAVFQRLAETPLPLLAPLFGFGLGEGAGDARAHLRDGSFLVLGVFLYKHVAADFLLGGGDNWEGSLAH